MKDNVDLTLDRDFARGIRNRVFSARQILSFSDIRNEDDFNNYAESHCYCCGKKTKNFPWTSTSGMLCESCEANTKPIWHNKVIKNNPFYRIKIEGCKLKRNEIEYKKPWFVDDSKILTVDRLRDNIRELFSM